MTKVIDEVGLPEDFRERLEELLETLAKRVTSLAERYSRSLRELWKLWEKVIETERWKKIDRAISFQHSTLSFIMSADRFCQGWKLMVNSFKPRFLYEYISCRSWS